MTVSTARARWPRRRPGVYFEATTPRGLELPRMDVAMLVGFAESGPLHVPVAVEDVAHFEAVFGRDVVLSRDLQGHVTVARLGAAVRSFFAGGGRRCWVVRVAGLEAETSSFEIPGLVVADGGVPVVAQGWARSPGSWADEMKVASLLLGRPIEIQELKQIDGASVVVRVVADVGAIVGVGDLLRVTLTDRGALCFVEVRSVVTHGQSEQGERLTVTGRPFWFASPVDVEAGFVHAGGENASVRRGEAGCALELRRAVPPEPGTVVSFTREDRTFFLTVENSERLEDGPEGMALVRGRCQQWLGSDYYLNWPAFSERMTGQVLTFELRAVRPGRPPQRLADLGFCPGHRGYWRSLPPDETRFLRRLRGEDETSSNEMSTGEMNGSPFPIAGEPGVPQSTQVASPGPTGVYLPIGIPSTPEWLLPSRHSTRSVASRDGLERLPADAFVDEDLRSAGTGGDSSASLLAWSEYRQFLAPDHQRRHLQGVHAALSVPEVSLIAVPDALHADFAPARMALPPAFRPPVRSSSGDLPLRWTDDHDDAARYVVEERHPSGRVQIHRLSDRRLVIPRSRPAGTYRYRVRVPTADEPWSEPLVVVVSPRDPGAAFGACSALIAPRLVCPDEVPTGECFEIAWSLLDSDGAVQERSDARARLRYIVEEAVDPGFMNSSPIYEGPGVDVAAGHRQARVLVWGRPGGDRYFRLRVARGDEVVWSHGELVRTRPRAVSIETAPANGVSATALVIHEHLLRLCAARGDLFAVLAFPAWYREDATLRHVAALVNRFGESEPNVLSFGAVYHPWLVVPEGEGAELRSVPPDGAACGAMARTALARGAWIASANQPFSGTVALTPALTSRRLDELATSQVNVLVRDPRGFVVQSEDTLAVVPELLPIHTRRLLILLRRAVLELGTTFAFEPNGAALERMVERAFRELLRRLHEMGAFSGRNDASAFRLRVQSGASSRTDAEASRFTVEIAVAPAGAIETITVRLVQSGTSSTFVEGA